MPRLGLSTLALLATVAAASVRGCFTLELGDDEPSTSEEIELASAEVLLGASPLQVGQRARIDVIVTDTKGRRATPFPRVVPEDQGIVGVEYVDGGAIFMTGRAPGTTRLTVTVSSGSRSLIRVVVITVTAPDQVDGGTPGDAGAPADAGRPNPDAR